MTNLTFKLNPTQVSALTYILVHTTHLRQGGAAGHKATGKHARGLGKFKFKGDPEVLLVIPTVKQSSPDVPRGLRARQTRSADSESPKL